MKGHTHLFGGMMVGATTAYMIAGNDLGVVGLSAVTGGIGGLFPDIDHPESLLGRWIPIIPRLLNKGFGHRTFTHSLILPIIFAGITAWIILSSIVSGRYLPIMMSFLLGYITHLIQDTLTKGGVPWGYPFIKKKISALPMRTGSPFEGIVTFMLLAVYTEGMSYLITGQEFISLIRR